jgi:hypothetical protein
MYIAASSFEKSGREATWFKIVISYLSHKQVILKRKFFEPAD